MFAKQKERRMEGHEWNELEGAGEEGRLRIVTWSFLCAVGLAAASLRAWRLEHLQGWKTSMNCEHALPFLVWCIRVLVLWELCRCEREEGRRGGGS